MCELLLPVFLNLAWQEFENNQDIDSDGYLFHSAMSYEVSYISLFVLCSFVPFFQSFTKKVTMNINQFFLHYILVEVLDSGRPTRAPPAPGDK